MTKVLTMATTDETVAYALKRSLIASGHAKPCGTTWGEFKKAGDLLLKDTDPLGFVEYGVKQGGMGYLTRDDDEDPNGAGLREL